MWFGDIYRRTKNTAGCKYITSGMSYGSASYNGAIIDCVSDMFYSSLLCPDNSTYQTTAGTIGSNGYVTAHCKCISGYYVDSGKCVLASSGGSSGGGSGSGSGSSDEQGEQYTITYTCDGSTQVYQQTVTNGQEFTPPDMSLCCNTNASATDASASNNGSWTTVSGSAVSATFSDPRNGRLPVCSWNSNITVEPICVYGLSGTTSSLQTTANAIVSELQGEGDNVSLNYVDTTNNQIYVCYKDDGVCWLFDKYSNSLGMISCVNSCP